MLIFSSPSQRIFDSLVPAFQFLLADFRKSIEGSKILIDRPVLFDFFKTVPVADCKASQIAPIAVVSTRDRTWTGALIRSACVCIGSYLRLRRRYFQGGKINVGICLHGSQDVICLISERLEGCTDDMVFIYSACQAHDRSAGIYPNMEHRVPVKAGTT